MDKMQFVGYLVDAVIILGGFIGVIWKFTQPLNELKLVIQKLNDNLDAMKNISDSHETRLNKHGDAIDKLDNRVGKLETKVEMYHKEK